MTPTLAQAIEVARGKADVIVDGSLLRVDRVGMTAKQDRPYHSGKHKCPGLNVQVIADPAGRLIWVSPTLAGSRYDLAAAREHGNLHAIDTTEIETVADTGYQGAGPTVRVPQRRRRPDPGSTEGSRRTRRRGRRLHPDRLLHLRGSRPSRGAGGAAPGSRRAAARGDAAHAGRGLPRPARALAPLTPLLSHPTSSTRPVEVGPKSLAGRMLSDGQRACDMWSA